MKEPKNINKPLTKWILFKMAMDSTVFGFGCFSFILFVIFLSVGLFHPNNPNSWQENLLGSFGGALLMYCFVLFICVFGPLPNIINIKKQEKALNFSFADEMKERNITTANYEDDKWFIYNKDLQLLAIRRDYIQRINSIKENNKHGTEMVMNVTKFDGEKTKIIASKEGVLKFEMWFLNKDTEEDEICHTR